MNSNLFSRLTLLVTLAVVSLGTSAQTIPQFAGPPFSALYVFGDSLSDSGNNFISSFGTTGPNPTSGTFIPSFPYAPSGTFSNGPTWVTPFASGLGLSSFAAASLRGGGNYAFGGATTSPTLPTAAPFPPTLQAQLTTYLSGNTVSPTALYVIAGGGNDALAVAAAVQGGSDPNVVVPAGALRYATTTASLVGNLRAAGATNIVVWNVPDLGKTPAAGSGVGPAAAGGTQISSVFNSFLAGALVGSGATIFDTFGTIGSIVANPAAFGFSNVTQACGFIGNGCDASTALFWDGIHPTAFAQTVIANQMLAVVAIPEPASILLLGMGVLALLAWRRRA
jgi:outer membrane lipase/esterase